MAITDLTGYTATLTHFSSFPSADVTFDVSGFYAEGTYHGAFLSMSLDVSTFTVTLYPDAFPMYGDAGTFSFSFTGGADVGNPNLIQWLVDNDATFTKQEPEPTATFDLSTLNLSAGTHSITVRAKAEGYEASLPSNAVSYVVEEQTLTVINTNNSDETASFTMPSGYTLAKFIGSEYDTSGGKFTIEADTNYVFYDGYALWSDGAMFDQVSANAIAKYTFVYAGAEATTYEISGTWVFKETLTSNDYMGKSFDVNFTSKGTSFVAISDQLPDVSDDTSVPSVPTHDGNLRYYMADDSCVIACNGIAWTDQAYRTLDFGSTPQTVSKEFYTWFTANAVKQEEPTAYTLDGTWEFNSVLDLLPSGFTERNVHFTSNHRAWVGFYGSANILIYLGANSDHNEVYDRGTWHSEEYRTITFDGTQTVTEEFYTWFTANAKPTVSGSYYFNDTLTMDYGGQWFAANFTCNGVSYIAMSDRRSESSSAHDLYLRYFSTSTECIEAYTGGWTNEAYRTVDFGSTLQTVSVEFKQWLENNAVEYVEEGIISFTINEINTLVEYQAERGMTWREWVDSNYDFILNPSVHDECYVISDVDNLIYKMHGDMPLNWTVHNSDGTHVAPTDVIQAGGVYKAFSDTGSND